MVDSPEVTASPIMLDPRAIDALLAELNPRQELVYRLAMRGLCGRCRSDDRFTARTEALILGFGRELRSVLSEAGQLSRALMEQR
jgi:hypothetical protein